MGKNAQGGNQDQRKRGKSQGAKDKKNNNKGDEAANDILPIEEQKKQELTSDVQNTGVGADSNVVTQADSQVIGSQVLGRGPVSEEISSAGFTP